VGVHGGLHSEAGTTYHSSCWSRAIARQDEIRMCGAFVLLRGYVARRYLTVVCVSSNLRLVTTYEQNVLDALGDRTRRSVFERLRGGARSVGDLAKGMDVSRPAVSQHLKVLKAAQLVVDHAEGTRRLYAVKAQGLEALRNWLDRFWDVALTAFKEAAERETKKQKRKSS
jgi:DNA-binding transcriptional ArsR family regulator